MRTFQNFLTEKHDGERLEINITSYRENGVPVSTVMKHRSKENGRWEYDADLDSGEQEGAKTIPAHVRELLDEFGCPSENFK